MNRPGTCPIHQFNLHSLRRPPSLHTHTIQRFCDCSSSCTQSIHGGFAVRVPSLTFARSTEKYVRHIASQVALVTRILMMKWLLNPFRSPHLFWQPECGCWQTLYSVAGCLLCIYSRSFLSLHLNGSERRAFEQIVFCLGTFNSVWPGTCKSHI